MKGDTDIVLQGQIWPNTLKCAMAYADLGFVNDVIISTSMSDLDKVSTFPEHPHLKYVITPVPENRGSGNMNIQIITSRAGLALTSSHIVVKMRSDQWIDKTSMHTMNDFFTLLTVRQNRHVVIQTIKLF